MKMELGEDVDRWLIGGIAAVVAWLVGRSWTARGILADLRQADAAHDLAMQALREQINLRFTAIEAEMAAHKQEQKERDRDFRRLVCEIVQQAQDRVALIQTERLIEINTQLATVVALVGELQKDTEALFSRMNRRESDRGRLEGDRRERHDDH